MGVCAPTSRDHPHATSGRAVPLVGVPWCAALGDGGAGRHGAIQGSSYLGILNPQPAQVSTCVMSSVQRPHGPSEPEGQGGGYCILYGEWKE